MLGRLHSFHLWAYPSPGKSNSPFLLYLGLMYLYLGLMYLYKGLMYLYKDLMYMHKGLMYMYLGLMYRPPDSLATLLMGLLDWQAS